MGASSGSGEDLQAVPANRVATATVTVIRVVMAATLVAPGRRPGEVLRRAEQGVAPARST